MLQSIQLLIFHSQEYLTWMCMYFRINTIYILPNSYNQQTLTTLVQTDLQQYTCTHPTNPTKYIIYSVNYKWSLQICVFNIQEYPLVFKNIHAHVLLINTNHLSLTPQTRTQSTVLTNLVQNNLQNILIYPTIRITCINGNHIIMHL